MFKSASFAIENRPGIENQSVEKVLKELAKLDAPDLTENVAGSSSSVEIYQPVIDYLSDWHLLAFLPSTNLLSEVRSLNNASPGNV